MCERSVMPVSWMRVSSGGMQGLFYSPFLGTRIILSKTCSVCRCSLESADAATERRFLGQWLKIARPLCLDLNSRVSALKSKSLAVDWPAFPWRAGRTSPTDSWRRAAPFGFGFRGSAGFEFSSPNFGTTSPERC